jgi:hypothetical protein
MAQEDVADVLRAYAEREQRVQDGRAVSDETGVHDDQRVAVADKAHAAADTTAGFADIACVKEMDGRHRRIVRA